ncbi:hypothetical protein D3C78_1158170 [compost metagenome]
MYDRILYKRLNNQTRNSNLNLINIVKHVQTASEARFFNLHILLNLLQLALNINEFIRQLQIISHITGQIYN